MTSAPPAVALPKPGQSAPVNLPQKIKFGSADRFMRTVKGRVDRYFQFTGRSPRDCGEMYLKTALILLWWAASYTLLVFVVTNPWLAVGLAVAFGLSISAIGFNIQHDGGHKAYSNRPWLNRIMASSLDLCGGSSYIWDHKHNTVHHTYANITGHDDDIEVGVLSRMSPHQPRYKFHRFQQWYLWLLYGFLPVKWQLFDDYWNLARGRIGQHKFSRPKGRDLSIFIGGKVVFYSLIFLIPALFHPLWLVGLFYLLAMWVNGLVLATVFQLAHVVEEAEFPMPDPATGKIENHWAVHQVETTVDFARDNRVLSWFLGGLNFQIEHHLLPRVCHVHYRKVSRIVEKACREYGLQYNHHPTFTAGVASHFRWLRQMGQPTT